MTLDSSHLHKKAQASPVHLTCNAHGAAQTRREQAKFTTTYRPCPYEHLFHVSRVAMTPIDHGLDVVAVRIQHERRVVARMVRARTGSPVVAPSGGERRIVECPHCGVIRREEGDMGWRVWLLR